MADPDFLAEQRSLLNDERTAPITEFIKDLRAGGKWAPFVAPMHGGVESRMISILRDPGPKTTDEDGSGMLSIENDDPTAELQAELADAAGIRASDFLPWNAYPWFIDRQPTGAEMREATPTLIELISLLPQLKVVLLQGKDAQQAWKLAVVVQPSLATRLTVVPTFHPGRQALFHPDLAVREQRAADRIAQWKKVGELLAE